MPMQGFLRQQGCLTYNRNDSGSADRSWQMHRLRQASILYPACVREPVAEGRSHDEEENAPQSAEEDE